MDQDRRLAEISRATEEIRRCQEDQRRFSDPKERMSAFIGEMDWSGELHDLLYS